MTAGSNFAPTLLDTNVGGLEYPFDPMMLLNFPPEDSESVADVELDLSG